MDPDPAGAGPPAVTLGALLWALVGANASPDPAVDVRAECDESGCVGLVICGGYTARLPEPHLPWNVDGVSVLHTELRDVDGDAERELLVFHRLTEPPRPAVGSRFHDLLTIYNLPWLTLSVSLPLRAGGAETEAACQSAVEFVEGPQILLHTRCADTRSALDAGAGASSTRRWTWRRGPDRFRPLRGERVSGGTE